MNIDNLTNKDWDFSKAITSGTTHSIHPYPAKFIPQIPDALISELSIEGDLVGDIFCGSGTTLVEANLLGRNALGIDANPLACLISEVKTTIISDEDEILLSNLISKANLLYNSFSNNSLLFPIENFHSKALRPDEKAIDFWFKPFVAEELTEILNWCNSLPTEASKKIALISMSSIIVNVSKQDSDTRYVRREKNISPGETFHRFSLSLTKTLKSLKEFKLQVNKQVTSRIVYSNILDAPFSDKFDLMVCSPPYPNAYSYHLYHMTRMVWLGMDFREFKKQEIGSHRKYSKPNASISTFVDEMTNIFEWLSEHVKHNKFACFVIGDSTIKGQLIDNCEILSDIAIMNGFKEAARINRKLQSSKKSFNPAIGKIKEEKILLLQRD